MKMKIISILFCLGLVCQTYAQDKTQGATKFKQLYQELPTPNSYRNASGAPGHAYWQQRADYNMKIEIDDSKQQIHGEEIITYYNNSPDALNYLWIQLDQNVRAKDSDSYKTRTDKIQDKMSFKQIKSSWHNDFDGGFKINEVTDKKGE